MIRGNDGEWVGLPTYAVRKAREAMNNPLTRSTALETHYSWEAHNMAHDASMETSYEGYAAMELTGGFPSDDDYVCQDPTHKTCGCRKSRPGYDAAGELERGIGACHHSRYWEGVSDNAEDRWAQGHADPMPQSALAEAVMSEGEQAARQTPAYPSEGEQAAGVDLMDSTGAWFGPLMSDAQATADARRVAPGYFRHP